MNQQKPKSGLTASDREKLAVIDDNFRRLAAIAGTEPPVFLEFGIPSGPESYDRISRRTEQYNNLAGERIAKKRT